MIKFDSHKTNIWFMSDPHYWHTNMAYDSSAWPDKETRTRKLGTVQDMSRHIVSQINKYVSEKDILFNLGDWSFGGVENIWNFRKQIICNNIYQINGNHDQHIKNNKLVCTEFMYYAHDLFVEVHDYLEIQIDKNMFCLMHYPIESWNRGFIHLHGHCHTLAPIKPNRLDVGIDNAFKLFGEYRPFSLEEILKLMK